MSVYSEKYLKQNKSHAYNLFCEMLSARSTYIWHSTSKGLNKIVNRKSYRQICRNFVN
jgi:CRISPR/Cas system CSM-associated protein Csm3 (group 7 of RAMP superfamily)